MTQAVMDTEFVIWSDLCEFRLKPDPDLGGYEDGALLTYRGDREEKASFRLYLPSDVVPLLRDALNAAHEAGLKAQMGKPS